MVEILDTTLREGEQAPGVTFSTEEKLSIANLIDDFGVNIIEAGHPVVSDDVFRGVKNISNQGYNADILAHCRAKKEDIDLAISCDVDWVGIFFCVSEKRLEEHFKLDFEKAIDQISKAISYAKDHGLKVRYTPEDSTRTEYENLMLASRAAVDAGADRISIADTVGAMTPVKIYNLVKKIREDLNVKINVHCHNDLGLATANSLAAYEAGATLIDVTVNGIGERVGITPLSEICLALNCIYKIKNNWKLENLSQISQIVSNYSGVDISPNMPIVGENAFLHKAGLHVSAVLNNPSHYELFPAELVGRKRDFILDKMSGVQTVRNKLEKMKLSAEKDDVEKILNYAKLKSKGKITDNEILSFLSDNRNENIMFQ
jgi:2-isopropylmalate synthase